MANIQPVVDEHFRKLLPPLATDDFEALKATIKADGRIRHPILVDEDGVILDGHHRFKIDPNVPVQVIKGLRTREEKEALAFRSNLGRRHMSPEQIGEVYDRMKDTAQRLNKQGYTQKDIGRVLAVDQSTVSRWFTKGKRSMQGHNTFTRRDLRIRIPVSQYAVIYDRLQAGEAQAKIANDCGISQPRVSQIAKDHNREGSGADKRTNRALKPKYVRCDSECAEAVRQLTERIYELTQKPTFEVSYIDVRLEVEKLRDAVQRCLGSCSKERKH